MEPPFHRRGSLGVSRRAIAPRPLARPLLRWSDMAKKSRRAAARDGVDQAMRAFRDAVRDIVAAEGWFEVALGAEEPGAGRRWSLPPTTITA